jgi:hypothetical protein
MEAVIEGEDGEYLKVYVTDNMGKEHDLTLKKQTGEIAYHQCEGYDSKAANRTREENEHNNQARRFAKWHVYRERGYDTVTPYKNPDRIVSAMLALLECSDAEFETHFGELQEQLQRHSDGEEIELPFEDADPEDIVIYRMDIWLDSDPSDTEPPLLEQYLEAASDPVDTIDRALNDELLPHKELPTFGIEAVSDLHYLYSDGFSQKTHWSEQPREREPDARIELLPLNVEEFSSFELMLVSHLGFQIRDCFLDMGLEPPEILNVQGPGKYESMVKQQLMEMYDEYFQPSASLGVEGSRLG